MKTNLRQEKRRNTKTDFNILVAIYQCYVCVDAWYKISRCSTVYHDMSDGNQVTFKSHTKHKLIPPPNISKSISIRPHWKTSFSAHAPKHSQFRPSQETNKQNKSISAPSLRPSQVRPPTQKSSYVRPQHWTWVNFDPHLKITSFSMPRHENRAHFQPDNKTK